MQQPATVPILDKTIRVLHAVASDLPASSIQQLADAASVPTSTCFRIVNTLESHHWITKPAPAQPGYRLATGLLTFLWPFRGHQRFFEAAGPTLDDLASRTGLGVKLSIREGLEAVTVLRAEPPQGITVSSPVGSRFPVALGATGAALLAGLDRTTLRRVIETSPSEAWQHQSREDLRARIDDCRENRVCHDAGSYRPSIGGWAAPVQFEKLHAALTITGFNEDLDRLGGDALRVMLADAVARIGLATAQP